MARFNTAKAETTRAGSPVSFPDVRVAQADETERSFLALGRTYGFDEAHGRQVARLALALFDQLQPLHGLDEPDRRLLQAAGILHDIGISVSFRGHHKHSLHRLAAILRLADVLDRDHRQAVRRVRAKLQGGRLRLCVEAEGEILVDGTALARKADLFQRTVGVPVEFLTHERTIE